MSSTKLFGQMLSEELTNRARTSKYEKYRNSADGFAKEVLGLTLSPDQEKVLKDVSGMGRVSVKSGHGVGKTHLASAVVTWFLQCFRPCSVITTAPTERQVKEQLWREIRIRKLTAKHELLGKPLTTKWEIGPDQFALGFSTKDVQSMQGYHSPNLLILVDEANGYPEELWPALESLISSDDGQEGIVDTGSNILFFCIGNPIEPIGHFFKDFSDPDVRTHTVSCLNHPNVKEGRTVIPGAVSKKWVERQKRLWGEGSAFWDARVIGNFPRIATDIVINLAWVERAEQEESKKKKHEELFMGYDVAEYGDDSHIWFIGTKSRKVYVERQQNIEPAEGINITKRLKKRFDIDEENITIDSIGAGATTFSVLKSEYPKINGFRASERAFDDKQFEDRATEGYFMLRNMFNPDSDEYSGYALGGPCDKLKSDLCSRKFRTSQYGRFMLEPKKEFRKRLKRSPDEGDAMMIAYSKLIVKSAYGLIVLPRVY